MKISNKNFGELNCKASAGLLVNEDFLNLTLINITDYSEKSFKVEFQNRSGFIAKGVVATAFYKAIYGTTPPENTLIKFVPVPQVWSCKNKTLTIKMSPEFKQALMGHI